MSVCKSFKTWFLRTLSFSLQTPTLIGCMFLMSKTNFLLVFFVFDCDQRSLVF